MKTKIIYEDNDIIVIYKPAGLATQTAKIGQPDVVSELKNKLAATQPGGSPYLGIVHRLDQPVEGLLVFGKNKKAAANLTAQLGGISEGLLNKQYYAVICGQPSEKEGTLEDFMDKTADNRAEIVPEGKGKKAILHYRVLNTVAFEGAEISLLDIRIETGRFHQIRAQLAHSGFPLLGDSKYGSEDSKALSVKLGVRNVALCAYKLELKHPTQGKTIEYEVKPEGTIFKKIYSE